ncbi:MAG: hypothetical protein RIC06_15960 [Cyclobacteriaceae bacterium]
MINSLMEFKFPLILFLVLVASCSTPKKAEETPEEITEEIAEELEVMEEAVSGNPEDAAVSYYSEFMEWVEENRGGQIVVPVKYKDYLGFAEELMPIDISRSERNGFPIDAIVFRKKEISSESNYHLMFAYYEDEKLFDNQFLLLHNHECFPEISFTDSKNPVVQIVESSCAENAGTKTYLSIEDDEWIFDFVDVDYIDLEDNISFIEKIFLYIPAITSTEDIKKRALLYQRNHYAKQLRKRGAYGTFSVLDLQSGYFKFNPGFDEPVPYEITMNTTYWNLPNGEKIVGFSKLGCDMHCSQEDLKFYFTSDGVSFNEVKNLDVIPELSPSSFLDDPEKVDECFYIGLLYELPQKGKDIRVYLEVDCPSPLKGTEVKLRWNGESFDLGSFEKSSN